MTRFLIVLMAFLALGKVAQSQTQADTSDAYWSIVVPIAQGKSIDMGKCLIGASNEKMEQDFVANIGSYKIRIDSIFFSGANADAFALVSGFPKYELNVSESKAAEFRFTPKFVGAHSAKINIVTQVETLEYDITGIGEEQKFQVISNWLDFGEVEISSEKIISDTVLIKNISSTSININNVVQLGPDMEQFEIVSGGGSFLLEPNVPHKMAIKFSPKYGGRTSGQLGFEYNGTGSPATVQLFGAGIGGLVYISDDSAYAGETRNVKLMMSKVKPEGIAAIASNFEAKIRFQNTILAPSIDYEWQNSNDSVYVTVKGKIVNSLEIASIPLNVGLGNVEETTIDVLEMNLIDDYGNQVEYDFETQSGTFKLLGVCYEGGARLVNPNSIPVELFINPNPAENSVNIQFTLIEKGTTTLSIIDNLGNSVYETEINTIPGEVSLEVDTKDIPSGVYSVILQTPNIKEIKQILIIK